MDDGVGKFTTDMRCECSYEIYGPVYDAIVYITLLKEACIY